MLTARAGLDGHAAYGRTLTLRLTLTLTLTLARARARARALALARHAVYGRVRNATEQLEKLRVGEVS